MQRTFIAVKIEPGMAMHGCISDLREKLKGEKIKWVDAAQLHITLRFLGDTDPGQVDAVKQILEGTIPGLVRPEVVFGGLGLFRSLRDPRVLWIGMDPRDALAGLKGRLDEELTGLGFQPEEREFTPHLTLARIKFLRDREALKNLLAKYRDKVFQKHRIHELIYYESILHPGGPEYIPLKKAAFKVD
jgi:2'-5' RNA ligase